jgi:PTH1 family peptidyl-tRNA hydrolase
MKVVVGLRNPETAYTGTRHNVGAEIVYALADRWGDRIKRGPLRVRAELATHAVDGEQVILALLFANMNVSGGPTKALLKYYKVQPDDLLVVHDDIDLPFARLRVQFGRGPGGNNGVRSVIEALGTREFWRLKVGVGRPPGRMDPAAFVLKRFSKEERDEIDILIHDAGDVVEQWVTDPERATHTAGARKPPA